MLLVFANINWKSSLFKFEEINNVKWDTFQERMFVDSMIVVGNQIGLKEKRGRSGNLRQC